MLSGFPVRECRSHIQNGSVIVFCNQFAYLFQFPFAEHLIDAGFCGIQLHLRHIAALPPAWESHPPK